MTPALKLSWRYCITDLLWGKFLCQASLCHLGRRRLFQSQTNYWGRDAVHDFLLMTSDSPSSGRLRGSGTKINTRGHFTMVSSLEGTLRGTLLCFIYHRFIQEGICWTQEHRGVQRYSGVQQSQSHPVDYLNLFQDTPSLWLAVSCTCTCYWMTRNISYIHSPEVQIYCVLI